MQEILHSGVVKFEIPSFLLSRQLISSRDKSYRAQRCHRHRYESRQLYDLGAKASSIYRKVVNTVPRPAELKVFRWKFFKWLPKKYRTNLFFFSFVSIDFVSYFFRKLKSLLNSSVNFSSSNFSRDIYVYMQKRELT